MARASQKTPAYAVLGAGRMGGALMSGWTHGRWPKVAPSDLLIIDPHPGDAARAVIEKGAIHAPAPSRALSTAECVLIAVKPQMFADISAQIAEYLKPGALVISILAGTTMSALRTAFPQQAIIRAMPNTPAAIAKGITAFTCGDGVSGEQKATAQSLLSAGGAVHEVETESLIDVVTAVSGSGPAYFFHMVEALEAAAIVAGMPERLAPAFARQTFIGAGALLASTDASASDLRKAVTSPNGTTQAALDVLMSADGLPPLMRETVNAALRRAKELGSG